jgi:hypothetical protein
LWWMRSKTTRTRNISRVCYYTLLNQVTLGVGEAMASSNMSMFRGRSGRMPYLRPENEE